MPIHNIFDQTLKIIARNYADVFLRLAFPDTPVHLIGTDLNVELALPVRPVDFIHRVEYEGQEYVLHIEFQLQHEADFPRRLCSYHGALTEQFKLPVLTLVLYLQARQAPLPDAYEVHLGDKIINRFSYPVLRLWDYTDAIRSGEYQELVPLLLTLAPEPTLDVLQEERELIQAEPDPQKRADLLALAVTIATRHFDSQYLWQFFNEEEVAEMRNATFIEELMESKLEEMREQLLQRGLQQGLQQGQQQGIQQGQQRGQQEDILSLLVKRFDPPASRYQPLAKKLETVTDTERLRKLLLYIALEAEDLAAFEQTLNQVMAQ